MEYKITKVKTSEAGMGMPVSQDLGEVVERMRQDRHEQTVAEMARQVTSELASQEAGLSRRHLRLMDQLPYLVFSGTFDRKSMQSLRQPTGLVLLTVDYGLDERLMQQVRSAAMQLRETLLMFRSVSRRSLKIVVPCRWSDGELPQESQAYLQFLASAQEQAARYYQVFCEAAPRQLPASLTHGCRQSQDTDLYYNPDAEPLRIIRRETSVLSQYAAASTDERGFTSAEPPATQREREQADFHACRRKAMQDYKPKTDDPTLRIEGLASLLARYCRRSGLDEESSVIRASHYLPMLSLESLRQLFRQEYEKQRPGEPMAMMTEKERIARRVRAFFERRYDLRYNEMKALEEFRPKGRDYWPWQPLTDRELRRIAFEEMIDSGVAWSVDVEMYVRSSLIRNYNPVHEFLAGCGEWDHKHDYILELASRVPTNYPQWRRHFHRWFLGMVAQWLGRSREFGNAVVPMLIGSQGTHKTTFCKLLIPAGLREYYIDDIKMQNAEQVERMLGRMALVNIDEYNSKTAREQAKIKRLLTERDVQVRRMRSEHYVMTQRMASFIATTNDLQPLNDPTGSRRYLCVEVTGVIDTESPLNYQQLYAQALWELNHGERFYFSKEEEAEIVAHNQSFQQLSPVELLLTANFCPAERSGSNLMRATAIMAVLEKADEDTEIAMSDLTKALRKQGFQLGNSNGRHGWYVKRR